MSVLSDAFHDHVSGSLFVGWYNPKKRAITNIGPWLDSPDKITWTALMLRERYENGDGKKVFPSYIWVVFNAVDVMRIFYMDQNPKPRQRDLERIKLLVDDIQQGGGFDCEF